jgi:hypothetical protein
MDHSPQAFRRGSIVIGLLALLLLSLFGWGDLRTSAGSETTSSYLPIIVNHSANMTETPIVEVTATATATQSPSATATTTATATATPSTTPTATATATPSATPTATATETPVASCSSKYPISLISSLLDYNNFNPPSDPAELPYFGLYSDETYSNKTQRRIYLAEGVSAGFNFARWRADTSPDSVTALVASLSGAGNIAQGFDEAPWPSGTALGAAPLGYPARPGKLFGNDGDWIYGSNASINNDVALALEYHIVNRTLMTLPISDGSAGAGSNVTYHTQRLGDFLLRGHGNQPGKGWYLDLVFINGYSITPECG